MGVFVLQLIVNGVVSGAIYAMMAVGFALVYNSTNIFHLAHGAVFSFSAYFLFFFVKRLGFPLSLGILTALSVSILLGLSIEIWVYRALRKRAVSMAAFLVCSLGILIAVQNGLILFFGVVPKYIYEEPLKVYHIGSLTVTRLHLVVIVCSLIIFPLLQVFLTKTRTGNMVRAISDHPDLALVIGLKTDNLYVLIAILGAALAAISGIFVALDVGATPEMGWDAVLIAAVAMIIGSVGYLPGAGIAALSVGLIQNLCVVKIPSVWQDTITFGILILFLVIKPRGMFGKIVTSRGA